VAKQFSRVLNVSEQDAVFYLDSCNGSIELALNMFLNQQNEYGVSLTPISTYSKKTGPLNPWHLWLAFVEFSLAHSTINSQIACL